MKYPYRAEGHLFLIDGRWVPADLLLPASDDDLRDRVRLFRGTSIAYNAERELAMRQFKRAFMGTALYRLFDRLVDWTLDRMANWLVRRLASWDARQPKPPSDR
jgi:hypothetical protein